VTERNRQGTGFQFGYSKNFFSELVVWTRRANEFPTGKRLAYLIASSRKKDFLRLQVRKVSSAKGTDICSPTFVVFLICSSSKKSVNLFVFRSLTNKKSLSPEIEEQKGTTSKQDKDTVKGTGRGSIC